MGWTMKESCFDYREAYKIFVVFSSIPALGKGKGKAIQLKARAGPENTRRLRLPDFKIIGT
jgi:hypothetical protein